MESASSVPLPFTRYQKLVVAILAFLQFTIILDFMILAPLGAILMPALQITTTQFGFIVSIYAFSAGASGLLAAGFADRFDRKKLLLFFYGGFIIGTFLCGIATTYTLLLSARMITGLFGGVIASIVMAITSDLFTLDRRGRVFGIIQTAFIASQVMGIPLGLFFSNHWGWHSSFLMIVAISLFVGVIILLYLRPIDAHLQLAPQQRVLRHLAETISRPIYLQAFAATALLSTGGFMLMPFSSAFSVNNLGISLEKLPLIYMVTGLCNIMTGPLVGRLSDRIGKFRIFCLGSLLGIPMVVIYTHLGITSVGTVILINVLMFAAFTSRMISSSALTSAIPELTHRGSFNALNSSIQQISGGIASVFAGFIVVQSAQGPLKHFDRLGYVVTLAMLASVLMMFFLNIFIVRTHESKNRSTES